MQTPYVKYIPSAHYVVSETFPFANPEPGAERAALITNDQGITLAFYSRNVETDESVWRDSRCIVGIWSDYCPPFIVLGFPRENLVIDHFLNGKKLSPDALAGFMAGPCDSITLMLIDESTGVMRVIREVAIESDLTERIKLSVESMSTSHTTADRYDEWAVAVQKCTSPEQMAFELVDPDKNNIYAVG